MNSKNGSSNKSVWLIGSIAAAIAIAAIVAVATQSSSDDVVTGVEEFNSVEVSGDPLPQFSDSTADKAIGMTAPVLTGKGFTGNTIVTGPGAPTLLVFSPTGARIASAKFRCLCNGIVMVSYRVALM